MTELEPKPERSSPSYERQPVPASTLQAVSSALAGYAASDMTADHPEVLSGCAFADWKAHIQRMLDELSTALRLGEPDLFVERLRWDVEAFRARGLDTSALEVSLLASRRTLAAELPENMRDTVDDYMQIATDELGAVIRNTANGDHGPGSPSRHANDSRFSALALEYIERVLEGQPGLAIDRVLELIDQGENPHTIYDELLIVAQREVGDMWHHGHMRISEEHLVTTTTSRAMTLVARRFPRREPRGLTVIAASATGDFHDLGPRALADHFEADGWNALCLGVDVPVEEFGHGVTTFDPDVVTISATISTQLPSVERAIAVIRERSEKVKVLVGGVAFDGKTRLAEKIGADGSAKTVAEAVVLANSLIEKRG